MYDRSVVVRFRGGELAVIRITGCREYFVQRVEFLAIVVRHSEGHVLVSTDLLYATASSGGQ